MTDNEAIKWLNKNRPCISMTCNKENADNINIATDMAIEVLEERAQGEIYTFEQVQELVKLNQQFAQEIENLKRQKGKWRGNNLGEFSCPLCGHQVLYEEEPDGYYEKLSNFCPFCGADMR